MNNYIQILFFILFLKEQLHTCLNDFKTIIIFLIRFLLATVDLFLQRRY